MLKGFLFLLFKLRAETKSFIKDLIYTHLNSFPTHIISYATSFETLESLQAVTKTWKNMKESRHQSRDITIFAFFCRQKIQLASN